MEIRIYQVNSEALKEVKKVIEEPEGMKETSPGKQEWVKNEFARNGYTLRDARSLGFDEDCNYLYINAEKSFFDKNEKAILVKGVAKLQEKKYDEVKEKIEEEQSGAAEGVGAIFG